MSLEFVNPPSLDPPRGFNHGVVAPAGARILFVAGQIGIAAGRAQAAGVVGPAAVVTSTSPRPEAEFVAQFDAALAHVLAVVREAGGAPEDIARMTVFVTDMPAYRAAAKPLGERWRARLGRHYPAMALVEVRSLVEPAALVEIEATAILPAPSPASPPSHA